MIRNDIKDFIKTIPSDVTIVAATKYVDSSDMEELLKNGINNFGENRVDSFIEKYEALQNKGVIWHFIGHLQRNKAKKVINKIDYLHSLDSIELAKIISKERRSTPLKCFIEVSINLEETKNGVPFYEVSNFFKEIKDLNNVEIVGLMMMGIKDSLTVEEQFKKLRLLRDKLQKEYNIKIPYLSMGMSDDYLYALKEGATHIRLGRILFINK